MTLLDVINFFVCSKLGIELDEVTGMPQPIISQSALDTIWHHIDYGRKVEAIKVLRDYTRGTCEVHMDEPSDYPNTFARFIKDNGLVIKQKQVLGLKEAKDVIDLLSLNTSLRGA